MHVLIKNKINIKWLINSFVDSCLVVLIDTMFTPERTPKYGHLVHLCPFENIGVSTTHMIYEKVHFKIHVVMETFFL